MGMGLWKYRWGEWGGIGEMTYYKTYQVDGRGDGKGMDEGREYGW